MKKLKNYNEFLNENLKDAIMMAFYNNLTIEEKNILPVENIKFHLNEGIKNTLSEAGKKILKKLADKTNNIINFISTLAKEIDKKIEFVLTNTKNKIKEKLKVNKDFLDAVKKEINLDKNAFLHDVKTCKEVSKFYIDKFGDKIANDFIIAAKKLLRSNNESLMILSESIDLNIIDSFVHHLNKIPPFNWLESLHHIGTNGANNLIQMLSHLTKHLGGPEFKLPVISSIMGIAFEYNIKGLVKHGLIEASELFSVPFIGLVIKMAGNIATFLAAYELCREIVASQDKLNQH